MDSAEEPGPSSPLQELTKLSGRECIALQGFGEVRFHAVPSHIPSFEWIQCVSFSLAPFNSHFRDYHGS